MTPDLSALTPDERRVVEAMLASPNKTDAYRRTRLLWRAFSAALESAEAKIGPLPRNVHVRTHHGARCDCRACVRGRQIDAEPRCPVCGLRGHTDADRAQCLPTIEVFARRSA
jgi:hypothetical protein